MIAAEQAPTVVGDPLDFIQAYRGSFEALGPQILDLMHRAANATAQYRPGGAAENPELFNEGRETVERIGQLYTFHDAVSQRLEAVTGTYGLGAIPIAIWLAGGLVTAAGLALAMSYVFRALGPEARVVGLLESGALTPEQSREILSEIEGGFSVIGGVAELALLALGGYALYKAVSS